jgi:hypothetical protein
MKARGLDKLNLRIRFPDILGKAVPIKQDVMSPGTFQMCLYWLFVYWDPSLVVLDKRRVFTVQGFAVKMVYLEH